MNREAVLWAAPDNDEDLVEAPEEDDDATSVRPADAASAARSGAAGGAGPRLRTGGSVPVDAATALGELFDRHHVGLCRFATVLLSDAAAAEEVVQEAFLRVHARWWRIRDHDRAHAYLRMTVLNLCRSRLRRRVTERRAVQAQWVEDDRRASAAVPEADRRGDALVLARALLGLPARQREAVVLHYYEDLPVAEVAAVLRCAPGTVKSQLAKARRALERTLVAEAGEGGLRPAGGTAGAPEDRP